MNSIFTRIAVDFNKYNTKIYLIKIVNILLLAILILLNNNLFADNSNIYSYNFHIGNKSTSIEDTLPPHIPPIMIEGDGSVDSKVIDMPDDDNIRSNLGGIQPILKNYYFSADSFLISKDRTTNWHLRVKDVFRDATAEIIFSDFAGNDTTIYIAYSAPKFRIYPSKPFHFTDVITGEQPFTEFLIVNEDSRVVVLADLKLKFNDQGFKIVPKNETGYINRLPKTFHPYDSLKFVLQFDANKTGTFIDSIGFGNGYAFAYQVQVSANVLSPVIQADDIDFYEVTVGDTVSKRVSVHNNGKVNLIIPAYRSTHFPFRTDLPATKPYILKPGARKTFNVFFTPDSVGNYKDSVVFISNATGIDSVTHIFGKGIKPGLITTSHNWGRLRIDRPERTDLPEFYPYTSPEAVRLLNTTEDTITIYSIEEENISHGAAFEFIKDEFVNMKIPPKSSKYVEVAFHPQEVGNHDLIIKFNNSTESQPQSRFRGIGILPKIKTENVDFDTTLVNDTFLPIVRKIRFTNENWEYQDKLVIDSLLVLPNGNEISFDLSSESKTWGTQGFKIFNSNRDIPCILNPGEFLEFDTKFVAQKEGPAIAMLKSHSDAMIDTTAILTGYGIYKGIRIKVDSVFSCVNDIQEFSCLLENYGVGPIHIDSLRIFGGNNSFHFKNPNDSLGFDVLSGQTLDLKLLYEPKTIEQITSFLDIFYLVSTSPQKVTIGLIGTSFLTNRNITTKIFNNNLNLRVDELLSGNVILEYGEDISIYQIHRINIKINYDSNYLRFEKDMLELGEITKFFFQKPKDIVNNTDLGELTFSLIAASDEILNGSGELLKFGFTTIPPIKTETNYLSPFRVTITPEINHCVNFQNSSILNTNLDHHILDNLEWIDFSASQNKLFYVYPNPVTDEIAFVHFAIKSEGYVKIHIENSLGQTIENVISKYLFPGNYKVDIPTSLLSSGLYWCTISTPQFTKSRKFIFQR